MCKKWILAVVLPALLATACRKKPDVVPPVVPANAVTLTMANTVDGQPLVLKTGKYTNAHGDTFVVNAYKYYISNIVLEADNGVKYKEPESYHLVDEAVPASKTIKIKGLPAGKYTKLHFMIGVDSTRNVSGAQTGDLDPAKGMFWTWQSGYIMAKIEGYSPQAGIYPDNLGFHLGGFSGEINAVRNVTLQLPSAANVSGADVPNIHMVSNLAEWFKTPSTIDFSITSFIVNPGPESNILADNYADMFKVDHVD